MRVAASTPDVAEIAERASKAAQRWCPGTTVRNVRILYGGASSLTYAAEASGPDIHRQIVLKMAPTGLAPVRNRDVLRQAAILGHVHGQPGTRTPRVLFEQPSRILEQPPFFAMEFVDGECVEPILDDPLPVLPGPDIVRGRATAAVRMLAMLHRVPLEGAVFRDESPVDLRDEVNRWQRALSTVDGELRVHGKQVCARLLRKVPTQLPAVLLHGDFRLGNAICAGTDIQAVIDWEIWGLGDLRIDLLWFLLFTDPNRLPTAPRSAPGMPPVESLVEEYVDASGCRRLTDLEWFDALIQYKQAAITALIVKHNRRRANPDPRLERSALQIEPLMTRALELLG